MAASNDYFETNHFESNYFGTNHIAGEIPVTETGEVMFTVKIITKDTLEAKIEL